MKGKSILNSIKDAVNSIEWQSDTKRTKALELCISIYNLYIRDNGDFHIYRTLSRKYFKAVIKTSVYLYEIKDTLIEKGILETDGKYNCKKSISKGYRFSCNIINYKSNYSLTSQPYHYCGPNDETPINTNVALSGPKDDFNVALSGPKENIDMEFCNKVVDLNNLSFRNEVYDWIDNYEIKEEHIKVNEEIESQFIELIFETNKYRYSIEKALLLAKELNTDLIQYKDKFYIETKEGFIERKTKELKLIFKKSVFDINNKQFVISRNTTNFRLDYNLTNMKSDLIQFLDYKNERLIEIDISNAQFSILSYLTKELDTTFIEKSQDGTLYSYIEETLNLQKGMGKSLMFRVAFDKIKKEQDVIRTIFPKTMDFIDKYKGEEGYKMFSNLLQRTESKIMIDGLLPFLYNNGITYFPIHDALRVKESEVNLVMNLCNEYFNSIGFKCNLRVKKNNIKQLSRIIKYRGYKEVEIEITKQDINIFKNLIDELRELNIDISETTILSREVMDKHKQWYLWNVWYNKHNKELEPKELDKELLMDK